MNYQELISHNYQEAVKGLDEQTLQNGETWYKYVLKLPKHLQIVYTISLLYTQVLNGGFHQYFFNPYGQFAFLTIDNLKIIKAEKAAEILLRALTEVNKEKLNEAEFRSKIFHRQLDRIIDFNEELGDYLDSLDEEFYNNTEDIELLVANFLKKP